jgi:hypothetical protein
VKQHRVNSLLAPVVLLLAGFASLIALETVQAQTETDTIPTLPYPVDTW